MNTSPAITQAQRIDPLMMPRHGASVTRAAASVRQPGRRPHPARSARRWNGAAAVAGLAAITMAMTAQARADLVAAPTTDVANRLVTGQADSSTTSTTTHSSTTSTSGAEGSTRTQQPARTTKRKPARKPKARKHTATTSAKKTAARKQATAHKPAAIKPAPKPVLTPAKPAPKATTSSHGS